MEVGGVSVLERIWGRGERGGEGWWGVRVWVPVVVIAVVGGGI